MATYHCSVKIISRSSGRSAVGSAAYRAGEKLHNEYDGILHDYTRKKGIVHTEIMLPENATKEFYNRETLWNAVEQSEKRVNSQTAREVEVALPVEFSREEQIKLVRKYIADSFLSEGMCADFAIHDTGKGNPHAHIMLTTREVNEGGFTEKNRDWNKKELLQEWRESWANYCNLEYKKKGLDIEVDHRSHAERGLETAPTVHMGAVATAMERQGIRTERGEINRQIMHENSVIFVQKSELDRLEAELSALVVERDKTIREQLAIENASRIALARESQEFEEHYLTQIEKTIANRAQADTYHVVHNHDGDILLTTRNTASDAQRFIEQTRSGFIKLEKNIKKRGIREMVARQDGGPAVDPWGAFSASPKSEKVKIADKIANIKNSVSRLEKLYDKSTTLTSELNKELGKIFRTAKVKRTIGYVQSEVKVINAEIAHHSKNLEKHGVRLSDGVDFGEIESVANKRVAELEEVKFRDNPDELIGKIIGDNFITGTVVEIEDDDIYARNKNGKHFIIKLSSLTNEHIYDYENIDVEKLHEIKNNLIDSTVGNQHQNQFEEYEQYKRDFANFTAKPLVDAIKKIPPLERPHIISDLIGRSTHNAKHDGSYMSYRITEVKRKIKSAIEKEFPKAVDILNEQTAQAYRLALEKADKEAERNKSIKPSPKREKIRERERDDFEL